MSEEKRLDMYGGILGGAVPLAVLIIGLVWLCLAERGGTKPFWACAWLALVIGLFFARKKDCLLYTSPSPRDPKTSRMPSSA